MNQPTGMILPSGSPLVQFHVERRSNGEPFSRVVWVNRGGTLNRSERFSCGHTTPVFVVEFDHKGIAPRSKTGRTVAVCLCMGRFIE